MKQIAVILSGCGVYDGSEIHESVLSLLCIEELGGKYSIFAPDIEQYHVINHLSGEPMDTSRNVLVESARIARGLIQALHLYNPADFDGLVLPGGFGAAKNLTRWAFEGAQGMIEEQTRKAILSTVEAHKPICAMCMAPAAVAKALQGTQYHAQLTVGSTAEPSPYDIGAVSQGLEATGAKAQMRSIEEIAIDSELKIVSAPCYMMQATISQVHKNIRQAIGALFELIG